MRQTYLTVSLWRSAVYVFRFRSRHSDRSPLFELEQPLPAMFHTIRFGVDMSIGLEEALERIRGPGE